MGILLFFAIFATSAMAAPPSVTVDSSNATYPAGSSAPKAPTGGFVSPVVGQPSNPTTPAADSSASSTAAPTSQPGAAPIGGIPPKTEILGPYRNKNGTVKIKQLMLDRYRDSVVRVTAKDNAGNELSRAMGVAVGDEGGTYIAAPLSLVLGNSLQWADKIEIAHYTSNRYNANIAFVNEELNLVLLAPEIEPAPVGFIHPSDERSSITGMMIYFDDKSPDAGSTAAILRQTVSAVNTKRGTLSISTGSEGDDSLNETLQAEMAGTGVINTNGKLIGMLLPNGRGVLSSAISNAIARAKSSAPIPPQLLGVIMGRGVLVDPATPTAYKTIGAALEAIRTKGAPKRNPKLFIPATTKDLRPKEARRIVIKVAPGKYKEFNTIDLPSGVALTGSGPAATTILGAAANKPAVRAKDISNTSISGFRIVTAGKQPANTGTVQITSSDDVNLVGNLIEANGGSAVEVELSKNIGIYANTFPRGTQKAVNCKTSSLEVEANFFLGNWPIALAADKGCALTAQQNAFIESKIALAVTRTAPSVEFRHNTLVKSQAGVRFYGVPPQVDFSKNIFFETFFSFFSLQDLSSNVIGRNVIWKSPAYVEKRQLRIADFLGAEPSFQNAGAFDFRIKAGSQLMNSAVGKDEDADDLELKDMGAFQRETFLGPYTPFLIRSLEPAVGQKRLAQAWGYQ